MRKHRHSVCFTLGATLSFVLAMFAGSASALNPATPEGDAVVYPAHIHSGVCPNPGDVVFPIEDIVPVDKMDHMGMATPDAMASPMADMSMDHSGKKLGSTTTVDGSLDDILGAEHAINLHLSPDQMSVYIACGDITGTPVDGVLMIELAEQNDSGVSGTATLTDNGDGTTTVVIDAVLVDVDSEGTPMATPGY